MPRIDKKTGERYFILYRRKSSEDLRVHLWFEDSKRNFIVSLVGAPGDIRTRVSTPKGSREYAHPFAEVHWTKYKSDDFGDLRRYKLGIMRNIKRDLGYNVILR